MTTPDLCEQLDAATPMKVGALVSGSRGERPALERWLPFSDLSDEQKLVVEQVWDGSRPEALIIHAGELHRLRHKPGGVPDPNGKRYGFVVRSVPLPLPPTPTNSGGRVGWVFLVLALVGAAFAGGWFAPTLFQRDVTRPSVRHADTPPSHPAPPTQPDAADRRHQMTEVEETYRRLGVLLQGVKDAPDATHTEKR